MFQSILIDTFISLIQSFHSAFGEGECTTPWFLGHLGAFLAVLQKIFFPTSGETEAFIFLILGQIKTKHLFDLSFSQMTLKLVVYHLFQKLKNKAIFLIQF